MAQERQEQGYMPHDLNYGPMDSWSGPPSFSASLQSFTPPQHMMYEDPTMMMPPPNYAPGPNYMRPPMTRYEMIRSPGSMPPHMGPPHHPMSLSGKVYPPNQPMVFNPANPNAPPIYPCGVCHKEVHDNDQAVLCESGCNFWFHRVCTGLSEDAFVFLTKDVYCEWVCDKCVNTKNIPLVKMKP